MSEIKNKLECLIIGSGPAGYTAAIYAARADMKPVVYEGLQPGGQLTITTDVENYPGYPDGIMGPQMMDLFKRQAVRLGADVRFGMVTSVNFSDPNSLSAVIDENHTVYADTVIIATGASAKWLGLPSEERLNGRGVSACAVCDGFFFRGLDVAIIGGGDTACEEALYLGKICNKVYMVVRKNVLRASKAMQHRVENTPNIEVIYEHTTEEILGENEVEAVIIKNTTSGKTRELKVKGFFIAIGHTPNTAIFKDYLELDETGYIITQPDSTRTNIPGVFACGDAQDHVYRQAVTAAGTGCMAALDAERYISAKKFAAQPV